MSNFAGLFAASFLVSMDSYQLNPIHAIIFREKIINIYSCISLIQNVILLLVNIMAADGKSNIILLKHIYKG